MVTQLPVHTARARGRRLRACLGSALALAFVLSVRPALAVDPFEIQVYDGTADAPGVPGLELHANYVASGLSTAPPPQLPENHVTHLTLEPSLGVLPWWEIGGYFETAIQKDGTFDYAGIKLRSKFVTPPGWHPHVRLGVNLEVSLLPQSYDRDRWGAEIRPIAAWENASWMFVVNPIVDLSLAGPDASAGPTFEPCGMALYKIKTLISVGLEYYSNFGPFSGFVPLREQEHYLFEVVNLLSVKRLELNVGVGEGLTPGSNGLIFKTIVGYELDSDEKPSVARGGIVPRRF